MPKPTVAPRILVLEGLYADTADIIDDCGGIGIEASPWNMTEVEEKIAKGIDGVLLTGGTDVNPKRYGERPCPTTQSPDYTRDYVELAVLDYARKARIPVLGICRGSQIMCVSRGGTLTQDIGLYTDAWFSHTSTQHDVCAADGARTFRQACLGDDMHVISLHHQCVAKPGEGMRIAALSIDGTPEAIESKDGLMLGVQFHPEMDAYNNPQAFGIFRWLVSTAARRMGGKAKAANFHDAAATYRATVQRAWRTYERDAQASFPAWADDYEGTSSQWAASTQACNPGGPARETRPHRKAGDPSIPSMRTTAPSEREMVSIIENASGQSLIVTDSHGNVIDSTCEDCTDEYDCAAACQAYPMDTPRSDWVNTPELELSLRICPTCHIMFDCIEDCDDHKKFVHPQEPLALLNPGPPVEEQTWAQRFAEMHEPPAGHPDWQDIDEEVLRIAQENGYEPTDWDNVDVIH